MTNESQSDGSEHADPRGKYLPLSGAGRAGRRLWRHRHQPALCVPRILQRGIWDSRNARQYPRRALAHLLGAHADHLHQVPGLCAAGRQPGRRRHPGAHGAGAPGTGHAPAQPALAADHARPVWNRAALRGRHDHAGALGAVCGRGSANRHAHLPALHRAHHHRHSRRALHVSEPRHGAGRQGVRAGDDGLVSDHRRAGRALGDSPAHRVRRHQSAVRRQVLLRTTDGAASWSWGRSFWW